MDRIPTFTILFLLVIALVLSPTVNCLSLNDREQLKQLTEEFVRKLNEFLLLNLLITIKINLI